MFLSLNYAGKNKHFDQVFVQNLGKTLKKLLLENGY
jgi:hypothetical protein